MEKQKLIAIGGAIIVIALASVLYLQLTYKEPAPQAYHVHADFAVFINGEKWNFAKEKYMSTEENHLGENVHLHDNDGKVIHFHAPGITIGDFLSSLGFTLSENCISTDENLQYCNNTDSSLKMLVNGSSITGFADYVPNDLDRILISYGPESEAELATQMELVSDEACIQSKKCPERGEPSDESTCIAGQPCILE